jgi:hypothetical protein
LVNAYPARFGDVKGDKREDKSGLNLDTKYESKIKLDGASDIYVNEGLLGSISLYADYGDFKTYAEAEAVYKGVADKVGTAKITCCQWVKNDSKLENITSSYWLPFDISGKMDPGFKDIVVQVQIIKGFDFDKDYKMHDSYSVSLTIGSNK